MTEDKFYNPLQKGRDRIILNAKTKKILIPIFTVAVTAVAAAAAYFPVSSAIRTDLSGQSLSPEFTMGIERSGGFELTDGADVRIMSTNILVRYKGWGGTPVKSRALMFSEVLNKYRPDVAAIQEACSDWHKCIEETAGDTYEFIQPRFDVFRTSLTTMIYNKNTLNLVDSGRVKYSRGDGPQHRAITWAVFETKEGGKRFAAISTHFDPLRLKDTEKEYDIIFDQAEELFDFVDELSEKYACPVFSAGDYNACETEGDIGEAAGVAIYKKVSEKLKDVKYMTDNRKYGSEIGENSPCYDHIFLSGNAEIKAFRILSDSYLSPLSDHYPIFTDVSL